MKQLALIDPVPPEVRRQIIESLVPVYAEHQKRGYAGMYQDLIGRRSKINLASIAQLRGYGIQQAEAATIVRDLNGEAYRENLATNTQQPTVP